MRKFILDHLEVVGALHYFKVSEYPGKTQALLLLLGALIIGFIWRVHFQQYSTASSDALESRAAQNLSLSLVLAESMKQLTARAQAVGHIVHDNAGSSVARARLIRVLADDPILKRLSLYDENGTLIFASHPSAPAELPAAWEGQLSQRVVRFGLEPFLPTALPSDRSLNSGPSWRLPFLFPVGRAEGRSFGSVMLVDMDIGYFASLFRNIELGRTGLVQLLDSAGAERLRVSGSGVVFGGEPFFLERDDTQGRSFYRHSGAAYLGMYTHLAAQGLTVVVNQQPNEFLAPIAAARWRGFWLNMLMTVLVVIGVVWLLQVLRNQHRALAALQQAQEQNRVLIGGLEEEYEKSRRAAAIDHLSGLFNRRQFVQMAEELLAGLKVRRKLVALLFIDLDRFKLVNDTLGHKTGDQLLQAVAGRIQRQLGPGDLAARFGGDEFVVLLAGDRNEEAMVAWSRKLVERLSAPYALEEHELNSSPSIGVALFPRDAQDVDSLLGCADAAMYSAKLAGRGEVRFFDASLNHKNIEEFQFEQAFGEALEEHQFVLHYQPQIRLETMTVVGYEALVRWNHPRYGLVYPDRFISVAERSGFIVKLGEEILRLACVQLADWRDRGVEARVAVNVSGIQLAQPDFAGYVLGELDRFGLAANSLELEITETAILDKDAGPIAALAKLQSAGVSIALDDFGAGYAGFAHLNLLPLNTLKIDRQLISQLCNSPDDSPIVFSTIALAKRLSLEVVAEGVETVDQLVSLRLAGCDIAQGYFFGRPLPVDQHPVPDKTFQEGEQYT